MAWTVDGIKLFNDNVKKDLESKFVKIPVGGEWSGILVLKEPSSEMKSWDGESAPTKKFNWETADGKILSASKHLSFAITEALLKHADKLPGTDDVAVEIHRKGTATKPEWFVFIKGGI